MVMQRTAAGRTSLGTACGVLALVYMFSSPAIAIDGTAMTGEPQSTVRLFLRLISEGYDVAPALMLGLGLLAVLPLIAIFAPVVTRLRRSDDATRRYRGPVPGEIANDIEGESTSAPLHAFLEVVDGPETKFAILRDMLRIGREDDNDIRIPSSAVHRYHAAIYREHLEDWHITDLSGVGGNGIRVNGQKCADAALHDGDIIELGPGRLRFRAGHI